MRPALALGCALGLGLGAARAPGPTAAHEDPAACHEFGIFGRNKIYLSHYPMFHAIHAYQAIIEVTLTQDGHDLSSQFFADRDLIVEGSVAGIAGPGSAAMGTYPSLTSGHPVQGRAAVRIQLRILGEQFYTELDEQG